MSDDERRLRRVCGAICVAFAACALPACVYDSDEPCGGGGFEVYGDSERCVCPEGAITTPTGCIECGEHEVATATACVCETGYSRSGPGEPCEEAAGLGSECDPSASECEAPFAHCEPAGDSGYCTSDGCGGDDDCQGGYACNADSVCERPPLGLGDSCAEPADCEGTEATFCDTFMTMTCQVQGCSLDPNDCFAGYECCDLSMFGLPEPLCVPTGACMP